MESIVTDHHQAGDELPDCPILHPEISNYPFARSAGPRSPGSWPALAEACRATSVDPSDLDLVALATVADVVPLVGENRSLVRRGLAEMRRARRPGLRALIAAAQCEPTRLDEGDLASAGAADQCRGAPLPGRCRGRAAPDRGRGAGGGDRGRAEPGQLGAAGDRARGRRGGGAGAARAARRAARSAAASCSPARTGIRA